MSSASVYSEPSSGNRVSVCAISGDNAINHSLVATDSRLILHDNKAGASRWYLEPNSIATKTSNLHKASLGMYQENATKFFTVSWDTSATEYYTLQIGVGGGVYDAAFFHFFPGGYEKLIGFSLEP